MLTSARNVTPRIVTRPQDRSASSSCSASRSALRVASPCGPRGCACRADGDADGAALSCSRCGRLPSCAARRWVLAATLYRRPTSPRLRRRVLPNVYGRSVAVRDQGSVGIGRVGRGCSPCKGAAGTLESGVELDVVDARRGTGPQVSVAGAVEGPESTACGLGRTRGGRQRKPRPPHGAGACGGCACHSGTRRRARHSVGGKDDHAPMPRLCRFRKVGGLAPVVVAGRRFSIGSSGRGPAYGRGGHAQNRKRHPRRYLAWDQRKNGRAPVALIDDPLGRPAVTPIPPRLRRAHSTSSAAYPGRWCSRCPSLGRFEISEHFCQVPSEVAARPSAIRDIRLSTRALAVFTVWLPSFICPGGMCSVTCPEPESWASVARSNTSKTSKSCAPFC